MRVLRGIFVKQDKTTITSNVKKKNIVQTPFIKLFIYPHLRLFLLKKNIKHQI